MGTVRILHASDLHISIYRNMVSSIDHFSHLRDEQNLNLWTLTKLAREFFKGFRKKMTASSYDSVVLKRLAHFIYEAAKRKVVDGQLVIEDSPDKVDAILLTGDLATTGSPKDIAVVKEFLQSTVDPGVPYRNLNREATLAAVASPVWYLPGNHDRFVPTLKPASIRLARWTYVPVPKFFDPGGTEFDSQLVDFQSTPVRVLGEVQDSTNGSSIRVVVIAADFTLKRFGDHDGIYGWLAQGLVDNNILGQLEVETRNQMALHAEPESTLCILWVIHFPPGFPHISNTNRLLKEELLINRAKQCGVSAILAGHTHEQVRYRKPLMNFDILCCGSTSQYVPPGSRGANRLQIIEISAIGTSDVHIALQNYKYKRAGEDGVSIAHFYLES